MRELAFFVLGMSLIPSYRDHGWAGPIGVIVAAAISLI